MVDGSKRAIFMTEDLVLFLMTEDLVFFMIEKLVLLMTKKLVLLKERIISCGMFRETSCQIKSYNKLHYIVFGFLTDTIFCIIFDLQQSTDYVCRLKTLHKIHHIRRYRE